MYEVLTHEAISIHALRVEGDASGSAGRSYVSNFYPRPPGGGRPDDTVFKHTVPEFLSTPSGWRATDCVKDCEPV